MMRFLLLAAALLVPPYALAHTRWFAYGEIPPYVTDEPTALYLSIWALIAFVIVVIGAVFERNGWLQLHFLEPKGSHEFIRAASTFTMVVGAFFIIAGTHEYLFSPNIGMQVVPMTFIVLQILVGLTYLVGFFPRVASLILVFLWIAGFFVIGAREMLEDIWVLSTALFIMVMGNDYFARYVIDFLRETLSPYKCYALSILRIGTGGTLLVLGFSEKILAPELGINFLAQHNWNFMQILGFPYSDYLFTLSAGAVEALFGLIFILGIMTRLNALVLAVFFTIPLFILGPIELAGHLPHFAAVVLLLLFGNGGYFLLVRPKHKRKKA